MSALSDGVLVGCTLGVWGRGLLGSTLGSWAGRLVGSGRGRTLGNGRCSDVPVRVGQGPPLEVSVTRVAERLGVSTAIIGTEEI